MRKLLLFTLCMATSAYAMADGEYPYLTFETSDGSITSVALNSYSMDVETESGTKAALKLELSEDGKLVALSPDGSVSFTLTNLTKMYFSDSDESMVVDGIIESKEADSTTEVYTITGIYMGKYPNIDASKNSLTTGVYILKTNNKQIKISIK